MEQIERIQSKEKEARNEYQETKDPRYLEILLECLRKREELLFRRLPKNKLS